MARKKTFPKKLRRLVSFKLNPATIRAIERIAALEGKTKTAVVEERMWYEYERITKRHELTRKALEREGKLEQYPDYFVPMEELSVMLEQAKNEPPEGV